ncbi:hypothetical protein TRFO_04310 [Tritrichomonas foetus]|uniref:Tubby C-terminal domain-containing protein n=1 Tax=Tritrichomonas foetus TaxID=1144522 RepID=A0A1J4KKQ6_9EUKA|nr:hypothetical protein TRFO_04310 [Tritrichomonas foetus]|eukprot:OHT10278.1 hypothetical protein TRFO_04310 [Tritrichomonas foetus]
MSRTAIVFSSSYSSDDEESKEKKPPVVKKPPQSPNKLLLSDDDYYSYESESEPNFQVLPPKNQTRQSPRNMNKFSPPFKPRRMDPKRYQRLPNRNSLPKTNEDEKQEDKIEPKPKKETPNQSKSVANHQKNVFHLSENSQDSDGQGNENEANIINESNQPNAEKIDNKNTENELNENDKKETENEEFEEDDEKTEKQIGPNTYEETSVSIEGKSEINENYAAYFITRVVKINLRSPLEFIFKTENGILFFSKSTGLFTDHIYISTNADINIKEKKYDYVVIVSKNRTHFVLQKVDDARNLLVIDFNDEYGDEYGPRKIEIVWPETNKKLISRIPKRSASGSWQLNFSGKYVLLSQKNAIMLDENNKPVILVRKIEKQVLELEVNQHFEPIDICTFAIASFVCPI